MEDGHVAVPVVGNPAVIKDQTARGNLTISRTIVAISKTVITILCGKDPYVLSCDGWMDILSVAFANVNV
jgi:hypothetical protein